MGWDTLFCAGHGAFSAWGLQGVSPSPPKPQGSCAGGNTPPAIFMLASGHPTSQQRNLGQPSCHGTPGAGAFGEEGLVGLLGGDGTGRWDVTGLGSGVPRRRRPPLPGWSRGSFLHTRRWLYQMCLWLRAPRPRIRVPCYCHPLLLSLLRTFNKQPGRRTALSTLSSVGKQLGAPSPDTPCWGRTGAGALGGQPCSRAMLLLATVGLWGWQSTMAGPCLGQRFGEGGTVAPILLG